MVQKMNDVKWQAIDKTVLLKQGQVEERLTLKDNIPVPSIVEFNIFGACNRSCHFCPVSNPEVYTNVNEGLSVELAEKVALDLREIEFSGIILFSAFSEPYLHKGIFKLIQTFKKILPNSALHIVTNGDAFLSKPNLLAKTLECGCDQVSISLYDGDHQHQRMDSLVKATLSKAKAKAVILKRRYEQGGNLGLIFSNRAGSLLPEFENADLVLPLEKPCFYPFYQVVIDYDGSVIMCAHDWKKEGYVGNLGTESFWAIWTGPRMNRNRKLLKQNNRRFSPCDKCDVTGDLIGRAHFERF